MKIIQSNAFDLYWKDYAVQEDDEDAAAVVKEIIAAVRKDGDKAVKHFASRFDKSSPQQLEVPMTEVKNAYSKLLADDPALAEALEFAAENIYRFSMKQREQFADFEFETQPGLFTGQRVIPVQRAGVYVPGGRFPLFSSVLMGLVPAFSAGVQEIAFASPPGENGFPDSKILAAAAIAAAKTGVSDNRLRVFSMGGAQAIAALAFGTESVPRADVIAGPGNKYVAVAKRLLYGNAGIDFIAGPSDVLVIADGSEQQKESVFAAHSAASADAADPAAANAADLAAADMIAQAEHDPDARARALVPNMEFARQIAACVEKRLETLPTAATARASLENGLIIVYKNMEEAVRITNTISPEHLELQITDADAWIPHFKNYGSLFIGSLSAEVLGDYSAGINHTLPTSGSSRFTGGLSVRHFLKTVTTLRCVKDSGFDSACKAAEIIARAEGLEAHALSAACRTSAACP